MNATDQIRVLVVDDHALVRSGLAAFLSVWSDLELVGEATNGTEALRRVAELQPDVVLMDLMMPGTDGVSATRTIRERFPNTRVLALTSFPSDQLVHDALEAGAIGYLLKDVGADELANAIRNARAGKSTLAPEAAHALITRATHRETPGPELSPQMAARLIVGRSTVKFHVSSILSKLGVTSRTEAVALALQKHLTT